MPSEIILEFFLFVQYNKNIKANHLLDPITIKTLPDGTKIIYSIIYPSIKEADCSDARIFLHTTVKRDVLRFKALVLISTTVLRHMLTPS